MSAVVSTKDDVSPAGVSPLPARVMTDEAGSMGPGRREKRKGLPEIAVGVTASVRRVTARE